jgi:hypothetical protein
MLPWIAVDIVCMLSPAGHLPECGNLRLCCLVCGLSTSLVQQLLEALFHLSPTAGVMSLAIPFMTQQAA